MKRQQQNNEPTRTIFLLEEESAYEMLRCFIPKHFPNLRHKLLQFRGKDNLIKQIPKMLASYPDSNFVILCDRDEDDCVVLKKRIHDLCKQSRCTVRIACNELESWYLAQLDIVAGHFNVPDLAKYQERYKNPDNIINPDKILKRITNNHYQKVRGSKVMGQYLNPDVTRSVSFKHFVNTLKRLEKLKET
jgi:hypothetical protein